MFLRNHDSNRVTKIEKVRMKDAIGALSLVVDSLSQSFEEVEHLLSPPKETDSDLERNKEVALQKCKCFFIIC